MAEEDAKKRKLNLQAVRAAVRSERNGDMFSEGDLFGEKYLVSGSEELHFATSGCTCIFQKYSVCNNWWHHEFIMCEGKRVSNTLYTVGGIKMVTFPFHSVPFKRKQIPFPCS